MKNTTQKLGAGFLEHLGTPS